MGEGKKFFLAFLTVVLLFFLAVYWFVPFNTIEFSTNPTNYNFSLNQSVNSELQYNSNMRFPAPNISYRIYDCPLQRQYDMKTAFEIMQEQTILKFSPVKDGEEISVTCQDTIQMEGDFFIAGEGGPTNITISGNFSVIYKGKIFLLKNSNCERPNVAIHELLHVLGFEHSQNQNNIMHDVSTCKQIISKDIINLINKIYSFPTEPDLMFEDVDVLMHGRYLDSNFSVKNNGLNYSEESRVIIFANGKKVKEIEISPLDEGEGMRILLTGMLINQINVKEIEFVIENDFSELDKTNNNVLLEIKK